jgi:hypothetical protein
MNRRIRKELDKLRDNLPIQYYMGIPNDNTFNIDIIDIQTDKIGLKIRYKFRENGYYFHLLPPEINNLIVSFMTDYITLKIIIVIPPKYPFVQPVWILSNIDINRNIEPIKKYFIDKILCHNKEDISLIYCLTKNILQFISTINFNGAELVLMDK